MHPDAAVQEELCLLLRVDAGHKEVINPSDQVVSLSISKVPVKVIIEEFLAFCGLDEDKVHRGIADGSIAKFLPIDAVLIVADVNAAHFVPFRIGRFAIKGTPTETEGAYKEVVEEAYVSNRYKDTSQP